MESGIVLVLSLSDTLFLPLKYPPPHRLPLKSIIFLEVVKAENVVKMVEKATNNKKKAEKWAESIVHRGGWFKFYILTT